MISPQSHTPSTPDHASDCGGELQPKHGTNTYDLFNINMLRRPVESALRPGVTVMNQPSPTVWPW